jgi:hypothetical protein
MSFSFGKYAKAIVAALIAGLTTAQVALDSTHPVTLTQWVTLGIGVALAMLGVAAVPNTTKTLAAPPAAPVAPPVPTEPPTAL